MPQLLYCIIFLLPTLLFSGCKQAASQSSHHKESTIAGWPPQIGAKYPDIKLIDHRGKNHSISDFRGKPLIIELTAMPCAGCQAFSGADKYGAYGKVRPQKGLGSFEEHLPRFGQGLKISDSRFTFMQLMLYDLQMATPSAKEIASWAKHFKLDNLNNIYVVAPVENRPKNSYDLIPGFHLVDENLILRFDSSGHRPKHNLYKELIPALAKMVAVSKN